MERSHTVAARPTARGGALPKAFAALFVAALCLCMCLGAGAAQALTTDKLTAKPTNAKQDSVLAGVATRFTYNGTVGDGEAVASVSFTFPEGTTVSEESQVKAVVLDGLTRLSEYTSTYTISDEGATVEFDTPVEPGLQLQIQLYKVAPPNRSMDYAMGVSYTTGDGATVEVGQTPSVGIVEQSVVEDIVDMLDGQPWVEAWNSVTFLRLFLNPQIAVQSVPVIFIGWARSLGLVCIGFPLAIPLGFCLSFMRMSRWRILRGIGGLYVNVVRGTPLFLQLYIYFFGLSTLGINIDSFVLGFLALALNSSAYLCEIFRAGIQSIPKGQFEAARSLGMTGAQTMFSVIIPQSVRRVIPTATSEFILLYKDTSLLASVGVMELMMFSKTLTSTTGNMTPYIVCACYYLVITIPLTKLIGSFERKLASQDGARPSDSSGDARQRPHKAVGLEVAAAQTGDVTPIVIQNTTDEKIEREAMLKRGGC